MEIFNTKIYIVAKLKAYGLTVGKYYEVLDSHQHFNDKCMTIINDEGETRSYNIGYFDCK